VISEAGGRKPEAGGQKSEAEGRRPFDTDFTDFIDFRTNIFSQQPKNESRKHEIEKARNV